MGADSAANDFPITETLSRLFHHPSAPLWNHYAQDFLRPEDLDSLKLFRSDLTRQSDRPSGFFPDSQMLSRLVGFGRHSEFFYKRLASIENPGRKWFEIPTMSREDIVENLEKIIPENSPFSELRLYRTTGTTGHPISVPHSRYSVATYQPLLEYALDSCGVCCDFKDTEVACFLIGAQQRTVTYATTLSYWNNAGFAKINIDPAQWKRSFDCSVYLEEFNPRILTGDPVSFSKLLELNPEISPKALITTAVAMSAGLRSALEQRYKCPVIEWYSLTETGPIGFRKPGSDFYEIISSDIFIECLDPDGFPVLPGSIGEITVSGGRNPFLPLLRYRTGDYGRLIESDSGKRSLANLEGRRPVIFCRADGSRINSVDLAACIHPFSVIQYEFLQKKNLACELTVRMLNNQDAESIEALKQKLDNLFGQQGLVEIKVDPELGQRNPGTKVVPHRSELMEE